MAREPDDRGAGGAREGAIARAAAGTAASRTRGGPAVAKRSGAPTDWHVVGIGVAWALLATLPVAAVAILWSAYYYLFAMCGVALALGALLASRARRMVDRGARRRSRGVGERPRARGIRRAGAMRGRRSRTSTATTSTARTRSSRRTCGSLERAHPKLPDASTLFFAGLKGNVAFQRADGPLLRWAYRDDAACARTT